MEELRGKACEGAFAFYDLNGNEFDPHICVFPLFVENGEEPPVFVGTGFYVTTQGVFAYHWSNFSYRSSMNSINSCKPESCNGPFLNKNYRRTSGKFVIARKLC